MGREPLTNTQAVWLDDGQILEVKEEEHAGPGETDFEGVVLFCPVCCSEAHGEHWGWNRIECVDCLTEFVVALEPRAVERGLYG